MDRFQSLETKELFRERLIEEGVLEIPFPFPHALKAVPDSGPINVELLVRQYLPSSA
jgi:hypothetical protein